MFGIGKRKQQRAFDEGVQAFNSCINHTPVGTKPHPAAYGLASLNSFYGFANASHDPEMIYPRTATMSCPKLGEVSMSATTDRQGSIRTLAGTVGVENCVQCPFRNMSPEEVQIQTFARHLNIEELQQRDPGFEGLK